MRNFKAASVMPGNSGGLNGSTKHSLEVYSQESENLKSFADVDGGVGERLKPAVLKN
jgi:hypothetical protein